MTRDKWTSVQHFLSKSGVDEVEQGPRKALRCTCSRFEMRKTCKHVEHVKREIAEHGSVKRSVEVI